MVDYIDPISSYVNSNPSMLDTPFADPEEIPIASDCQFEQIDRTMYDQTIGHSLELSHVNQWIVRICPNGLHFPHHIVPIDSLWDEVPELTVDSIKAHAMKLIGFSVMSGHLCLKRDNWICSERNDSNWVTVEELVERYRISG